MKFLLFLLALLIAPAIAGANLKIVTTTTDYADMARQIGGDRVDVHSVMKGPENVHNVMAKPTEMVYLNQADLFVHSGLDTEPRRDNLLRGARNPKVNEGQVGWVDMSNGITLKDVPTGHIDRSMGDVHSYGNPHYTLNPEIAQRMAVTLVKAMMKADPANADFYKANATTFVKSMGQVAHEIRQKLTPYAGLKVVTFHDAWKYFGDAVPVSFVGTIEPQPAITPSPAQVKATIEMMKQKGVKVVICETYDDDRLAKYVAEQTGAVEITLPDHVNGLPGVDTYQKLFQYDADKLVEAARAAGVQPVK
jgi:zinc/manganese transport system substrate-binding protein